MDLPDNPVGLPGKSHNFPPYGRKIAVFQRKLFENLGFRTILSAPSMGSNLAVKVRYTLGSRKWRIFAKNTPNLRDL
jgi:hypothetical protein